MLALKDFFSPVLKQSRGPIWPAAVAARMIGIIEAEDTAALSDCHRAQLAADGIHCAADNCRT